MKMVAATLFSTVGLVFLEASKQKPTVDTSQTLHAFLAPEYRLFFYGLCAMALLIYCPIMMWLGYRRFVTQQSAQLA